MELETFKMAQNFRLGMWNNFQKHNWSLVTCRRFFYHTQKQIITKKSGKVVILQYFCTKFAIPRFLNNIF